MARSGLSKLWYLGVLAVLASACESKSERPPTAARNEFSNPVISGFAPDPSIVRVADDFYLVNSTFEYFPGIPVYHSKDLVNWKLISYALHDRSQVNLDSVASGSGIHASTIRYHDGTFYVVTTNNIDGELINFIITATDPRGPWSEPHVLDGAPGIDPSLLFDDDGRVWYAGNHAPTDPAFDGEMEIWLQELDLQQMALRGERYFLWRGCCQGAWAEGPHIYKYNDHYYLLVSEGGTAYEHALSVAISRDITGPYENNPRNPVLSHRQLGYDHPITGVGHADLVELADGRWYAVALGWRLIDGMHGILGRETFLLPVEWETERYWWKEEKLTFPVFSPLTGKIELRYPQPFPGTVQATSPAFSDDFATDSLHLEWNFRRTHEQAFHNLTDQPGVLRLRSQPGTIAEHQRYSFIGIRQRHMQFEAETQMTLFANGAGEEAGLVLMQNDRSAYLMLLRKGEAGNELILYKAFQGELGEIARTAYASDTLHLAVAGDYLDFTFRYSADGEEWQVLQEQVDGTSLSPSVIEGYNYTGIYVGLFATSNGAPQGGYADFEFFRYLPTTAERDHWYYRQRSRQTGR